MAVQLPEHEGVSVALAVACKAPGLRRLVRTLRANNGTLSTADRVYIVADDPIISVLVHMYPTLVWGRGECGEKTIPLGRELRAYGLFVRSTIHAYSSKYGTAVVFLL